MSHRTIAEETYYSPSRMKLFLDCPYAHKLRYVDGIKVQAGGLAAEGKEIHELIAQDLRGELDQAPHNYAFPPDVSEIIASWEANYAPRYKKMIEKAQRNDAFVAIEETMVAHTPKSRKILGFPDLVIEYEPRNYLLVDWKTGWRSASSAEIARDVQAWTYAFLIAKLRPAQKVRVEWCYIRREEMMPAVFDIDGAQGLRFGNVLDRIIDKIEATEGQQVHPTPGSRCGICNYVAMCNARDVVDGANCNTEDLAARYLAAKAEVTRLELLLRERLDVAGGRVEVGGAEVGYFETTARRWSDDAMQQLGQASKEELVEMLLRLSPPRTKKYANLVKLHKKTRWGTRRKEVKE